MYVDTQARSPGESPAQLDEPARLLLRAAELIERHGHARGVTRDELGGLCILGAINIASGKVHDSFNWIGKYDDPANGAWSRICLETGCRDACDWNNAPERTQAEVVAKLRAVAFGGSHVS